MEILFKIQKEVYKINLLFCLQYNNRMSNRTETEWKEMLTEQEYDVMRNKGTESPFNNEFNDYFPKNGYFVKLYSFIYNSLYIYIQYI